jgi:hypothetical protein
MSLIQNDDWVEAIKESFDATIEAGVSSKALAIIDYVTEQGYVDFATELYEQYEEANLCTDCDGTGRVDTDVDDSQECLCQVEAKQDNEPIKHE